MKHIFLLLMKQAGKSFMFLHYYINLSILYYIIILFVILIIILIIIIFDIYIK